MGSAWVPLFDKYKVDLKVITKAVPIGYSVSPATDGTMYVTAGGASRSLYSFPAPDTFEDHTKPHAQVVSYYWDADGTRSPRRSAGLGSVTPDIRSWPSMSSRRIPVGRPH